MHLKNAQLPNDTFIGGLQPVDCFTTVFRLRHSHTTGCSPRSCVKCGVMTSCAHRDSYARNRKSAGEVLGEPHEVTLKHPGGREPPTARTSGEKHQCKHRVALHLQQYQYYGAPLHIPSSFELVPRVVFCVVPSSSCVRCCIIFTNTDVYPH